MTQHCSWSRYCTASPLHNKQEPIYPFPPSRLSATPWPCHSFPFLNQQVFLQKLSPCALNIITLVSQLVPSFSDASTCLLQNVACTTYAQEGEIHPCAL